MKPRALGNDDATRRGRQHNAMLTGVAVRRRERSRQDHADAIDALGANLLGESGVIAQIFRQLHEALVRMALRQFDRFALIVLEAAQPVAGALMGFAHHQTGVQPTGVLTPGRRLPAATLD